MSYKRLDPFVYGDTERFKRLARQLLKKYGKVCVEAVKELRDETDYPLTMCHDVLLSEWYDMRMAQLETDNAKLRVLCSDMYCDYVAGHYDDMAREYAERMRKLDVEVST